MRSHVRARRVSARPPLPGQGSGLSCPVHVSALGLPQPCVNRRLQARVLVVAMRWRDGTARVRWNEYADDDHEEAISTFVEVEAAIEHFPGAGMVLVRVASVDGALRDGAPWRTWSVRHFAHGSVGTGKLLAGDATCSVSHG